MKFVVCSPPIGFIGKAIILKNVKNAAGADCHSAHDITRV